MSSQPLYTRVHDRVETAFTISGIRMEGVIVVTGLPASGRFRVNRGCYDLAKTAVSEGVNMSLQRLRMIPMVWLMTSMSLTARADGTDHTHSDKSVKTPGLSVEQLTQIPAVIFGHELKDVPGRNLIVVALEFPPASAPVGNPTNQCIGHRHPGSTYVYVTKGTVRLGIAGQPVQVLQAGRSFYEPANALHTIAESASTTEPASAIAVLILPKGAPILTPEKCTVP